MPGDVAVTGSREDDDRALVRGEAESFLRNVHTCEGARCAYAHLITSVPETVQLSAEVL